MAAAQGLGLEAPAVVGPVIAADDDAAHIADVVPVSEPPVVAEAFVTLADFAVRQAVLLEDVDGAVDLSGSDVDRHIGRLGTEDASIS